MSEEELPPQPAQPAQPPIDRGPLPKPKTRKGPKRKGGGGKFNAEERAEMLAFCAEMMVRLRSSYKVEQACMRKYGVDDRTVRTWMKKVRTQWAERDAARDIPEERGNMYDTLNSLLALSLSRTKVVKNADGTVVMTKETRPDGTVLETPTQRPEPDIGRALHACRELVHLIGLNRPVVQPVKIETEITNVPDPAKMSEVAVEALRTYLTELAPGGDVSKLAGDYFAMGGSKPK